MNILIVDDEDGIRYGLTRFFEREGFAVFATGEYSKALDTVREIQISTALLDIRLKGHSDGIALLEDILKIEPELPVIMITGHGSISSSVAAMKRGAADYILKPIDNSILLETVKKNLELKNLRNENNFLKSELRNNLFSYDILTENRQVKEIFNIADKIKDTKTSVLITGESGTGKEVLAKYIHFTGNRKDANFVSINCAALSDALLLSELFGHEKGSFTGAVERKIGKFELADKGTLFLDEIGDMPLGIQAKFLRVLEENSFERVGGTKSVYSDVRIITATNRNLKDLISKGLFRSDLYFRLNVISITLPPLRDRPEDILLLITYFINKYNEKYNKNISGLSKELIEKISAYHWPGNIRELQNLINQAVLLNEGEKIRSFNFFDMIEGSGIPPFLENSVLNDLSLKRAMENISAYYEKRIIKTTLNKYPSRSKAAESLGITRKTLYRKIEMYGLEES